MCAYNAVLESMPQKAGCYYVIYYAISGDSKVLHFRISYGRFMMVRSLLKPE